MTHTKAPIIRAGLDSPGFSEDLSTWSLQIDEDGTVVREIRRPGRAEHDGELGARDVSRISAADVADILAVADRVGFHQLAPRIESRLWRLTDQETISLAIRSGETLRRVEVYGPFSVADEEPVRHDLRRFVRVWETVTRLAKCPLGHSLSIEALDRARRQARERDARDRERRAAFEAAAARRGVLAVDTIQNGFARCPHCGVRFALYSEQSWDGRRHRTCGTTLELPSPLQHLATSDDFRGLTFRDGQLQPSRSHEAGSDADSSS